MNIKKFFLIDVIFAVAAEGDSLGLHCASLLRTIFASLARAHERVLVQNIRDFPQSKLDSEINALFLLNKHGDLYFLLHKNIVYIILFNLKQKYKNLSEGKKI